MGSLPQRSEAIVLRHIDYGDADQIVTLLTPEQGLQKGFAKSARKSRKRFGATLEPFTSAVFHWRAGKGSLWSLQDAELIDARFALRRDLQTLALASYGVELLELLVEEAHPSRQLYELLVSYLDFLTAGGVAETARLLLELRLIHLLGYLPLLSSCSECQKLLTDQQLRFDLSRGGSLCPNCSGSAGIPVSLGTLGSLSRSLKVAHDRFSGFQFGATTHAEAHQLLQQVLRQLLPREPKSLRFLV